jgi:peroxiredoxin
MAKLEKGMKMPNFKLDTVFGTEIVKDVTFEQLVDGKPTFFWFQRYIGCPPCRMDVHLLSVAHPEFVEKGANIVVVMQSKPEIVQRDMIDKTLPFHLICDTQQELYKTLELGERKPGWRDTMTEEDKAKQQYKAEILPLPQEVAVETAPKQISGLHQGKQ